MSGVLATAVVVLSLSTTFSGQESNNSPAHSRSKTGYVYCASPEKHLVPVLLQICSRLPAGNLDCGQEVNVLERQGAWLRITLPDNVDRFIDRGSVSQADDKFVPFDSDSGIVDVGAPDCPSAGTSGISAPRVRFAPDAEYSDKARNAGIQGTVRLSLFVGVNGLPHDIRVERGLGYGLDEEAVKAVRRWKFDPAKKDGTPIDFKINIEVSFRLFRRS